MINQLPFPQDRNRAQPKVEDVEKEEQVQPITPPSQVADINPSFKVSSNAVMIVVAAGVATALIALLMSFKPESSTSKDSMSDFMFDRWLNRSFYDDEDDYRPSRSNRESNSNSKNGWEGFIPPIIINNPGQNPTILGGHSQGSNGGS